MAGHYDDWLTRDPDPDWDRVRLEPQEDPVCADCGRTIDVGPMSVITDGGHSRTYCSACGHARSQAGWLFDARPLTALRKRA